MDPLHLDDPATELLLFALTPPRVTTAADRLRQMAAATTNRLGGLGLDALVLYDIDDESDRNPGERPYPFMPTIDPATFLSDHLQEWPTPVVVYRAVRKHDRNGLRSWLAAQDAARVLSVLVGAASGAVATATTLAEAQSWSRDLNPDLVLGGVAIPERHRRRRDEHLRMLAKQESGCRFFVTQVVYDVNAAKDVVSDYVHECAARGVAPAPVVFTFSVCGSVRTLQFLQWLGVEVPHWIENELVHSVDTLETSFDVARAAAMDLIAYCRRVGLPFGINVESVSIRRVEIEASVRLAAVLAGELRRPDRRPG